MIDNSYILGLFGGGFNTGSTGFASLAPPAKKAQPTPPWDARAIGVPEPDALVRGALGGRRIIDENAARIDVAGASGDYAKLFALYQGLETLNALVNRASVKGISTTEQALLTKRFASGLAEVGGYVSTADLEGLRLVQGTSSALSKSSAAVPRDSARSLTGPIHEGSLEAPVTAFQGEVAFDITIRRPKGLGFETTNVPIDLNDLGSKPRTLDNVLKHINDTIDAAGFETRIGRELIKAEPKVITVNGKPVTLPAAADRFALVVRAVSTETVGFAPAETADAVYVVQGAGITGGHQLLKFQSDLGGDAPEAIVRTGETQWVEGRASQTSLAAGIETVRASATGPDGSLWVVADVDAGPENQPIKGERDVTLSKYDSAGRLVATRSLGAASTASGYAIAVDADGNVAVAGSVTGALNTSTTDAGKTGAVATVADSFVTVFNADGEEQWTQRRGARAADEATAVSFGADGTVYVAGRAQSAMTGAAAVGGWDGYIQSFQAAEPYPTAGIVAKATATTQFGTSAEDRVDATAIDGSNLYTAGVENGRAVVRSFTLGPNGAMTPGSRRDLGPVSGEIAGIAVADGKVILTGTTRNDALTAGTINRAHSGGTDAFVAVLSTDLQAGASDRLTYYGTAGDDSAADVKVHDGKVWITGIADRPPGAKDTDPTEAYLARLDPLSGAVEWSRRWAGDGDRATPMTLAVASGGASVLDRLGLPNGEIDQSDSKLLSAATSLRTGDRFYVSPADGGRSISVTITAKDTLQTLARKIEQASQNRLKVTIASEGGSVTGKEGEVVTTTGGFQRLSVTARDGKTGAVLTPGEPGRDALAGLGLSPGYIGQSTDADGGKTFGLGLPGNLSLSSPDAIKAAGERIQAALKGVRDAYRALSPVSATPAITGTVPAYLTAQLANYQAALTRLGG